MCGVCGALGGPLHWAAGNGVLDAAAVGTQRAERARLARMLDHVTRRRAVRVSTWAGTSFVVSGPTGAQEIAVACPNCKAMLQGAAGDRMRVRDVAELLRGAL